MIDADALSTADRRFRRTYRQAIG